MWEGGEPRWVGVAPLAPRGRSGAAAPCRGDSDGAARRYWVPVPRRGGEAAGVAGGAGVSDENEAAANQDHAEAVRQMDGEGPKWKVPKKGRRIRGKVTGAVKMDETTNVKNDAGKRDVTDINVEQPPAAKCLQLPPNVENFDMTKEDKAEEETQAAANVKVPE